MKIYKFLFPLLFLIVFLQPSVSYSSIPDYIEKNTLDDICRYSKCSTELKDEYESYFVKPFHKAFAVSYEKNKVTDKYTITSFGWSYKKSNKTEAKSDAKIQCKKNTHRQTDLNKYCQLLFINSSVDEKTYKNLTTGTEKINEDECTQFLSELPITDFQDHQVCDRAKLDLDHSCYIIAAIERGLSCGGLIITPPKIPKNAHKDENSWTCNTNYYKDGSICRSVPANAYSHYSSNFWYCNTGYRKSGNSCVEEKKFSKNLVYLGIAIFILWLFSRKGDKKPKPSPQESPSHRAQPKPSPRPKPKPKPKPRRRKVKDPQTLLIEIGVAVAMADGNLADIEGITINKWMKKMLDLQGNNEKLKKLFNDTLRDAISSAKTGSLDLRAICLQLNSQGTNKLKHDALTMAYEVMGSDGHIHEKEAEMIHFLVTTLEIHSKNQEDIRDQFIIKTLIESDFNFINLLGMSISASKESKCKKLKEEFRKWNSRMNSLPSSKERKNVQKVLDLIGKARKNNDC